MCDVNNSRQGHDLPKTQNDRVISPYLEGFIFTKHRRPAKFREIKTSRKFRKLPKPQITDQSVAHLKHINSHMKVRIQNFNTIHHKTISLFLGELTVELNYKINQRKLGSRTHNKTKKKQKKNKESTKKEIL